MITIPICGKLLRSRRQQIGDVESQKYTKQEKKLEKQKNFRENGRELINFFGYSPSWN